MRRLLVLLIALGSMFLAGCSGDAAGSPGTGPSENVLNFSSTTVDGAAFEGSSLDGKPTVLWFWAPWCPTCLGQVDGVSELATTYGGRLNVVGVGSLDSSEAIDGFAARVPADFPQLDDPDGEVWKHFGVTAQSTYVVLGADREVVATGSLSDAELADTVAGLLE